MQAIIYVRFWHETGCAQMMSTMSEEPKPGEMKKTGCKADIERLLAKTYECIEQISGYY